MKIIRRILKAAVLCIVVLLIVICACVYFFGERAVKLGVESGATKVLGVVVDIDDVDISILKSKVTIAGLVVKNPPGYAHTNLLEMDKASVKASIRSLMGDTVRIEQINLDGVNLVIEQKGLSNNLNEVIERLKSREKAQAGPAGKELHIDQLEITNTVVRVKLIPMAGTADTIDLHLTPIRMSNLGSDNKLDAGVLAGKILAAIAKGIAEQGVNVLPREMLNTIKGALGQTIDLGKKATEKGKELLDSGKEIGTEIIEDLKGILKPRKKD